MPENQFELNDQTLHIIKEIGTHMPGGFFLFRVADPKDVIYANSSVFEIYGCESEEQFRSLTGNSFRGMVHPDDYAEVTGRILPQGGSREEQEGDVEYRILCLDGSVRWVEHHSHFTKTKAYGGILAVFISDITQKKLSIETGTAARDAVIATLTNSYNTVWLINDVETESCSLFHTDLDQVHDVAIRNALSNAKYTDTKTQYVETMVAKEDRERMQEQISLPYILKQFETRDQFTVRFVRALESGPRHYRIDFGKVYMPGGRIGVTMGFRDVEDEARQEKAMQEALEEARRAEEENRRLSEEVQSAAKLAELMGSVSSLLTNMPAMSFSKDIKTGKYLACNQAFAEYAGKSRPEEVVGLTDHEIFDKATADHFVEDDRKAIEMEQAYVFFEDVPDATGKEFRNLQTTKSRFVDSAGRTCLLGMCVDVTELTRVKSAEAQAYARQQELEEKLALQEQLLAQQEALKDALAAAEEANKAKTAFLSNMSHEIRTPMNAIIGLDNIALNDPSVSGTTRDYLEKIGASAHHLLGIINDILDMSRIESGRMVIRSEEFSFAKMLSQVNTIINGQCRDKEIHYECHVVGNVDDYYIGDDMKLRQVLINILGNAVKFTPKKGHIQFTVQETARFGGNSTLRFVISDTGIGMSKEYLPRLFEAFSQEDSSSTNQYGSTGLGMPITKSIVELMNGHIEVKSQKGVGTTFTVTLTLLESERKGRPQEEGMLHPHEMCVLVIDDDPIACEHARVVLGQVGVSCEMALSGEQGLDMVSLRQARREPYNLILVDWRMPGMDGLETTRRIRAELGDDTPVIILTSFSWDEIEEEAKTAGVDAFVAKPLFAGSVLDEFREVFRKKNAALVRETADLTGRRVLLAEDVSVNAEIMMMVLSMREVQVEHAGNGRIAVSMYAEHEAGYYDAVLMDMRMPEMDGLEATRLIRSMDREDAKTIPIIALTANAFDEDVQRSMQAGLNAHLSKPVEPEALFRTLEGLVKP